MWFDELDERIRLAIAQEIKEANLTGLEDRVVRRLTSLSLKQTRWQRVRERFSFRLDLRWVACGIAMALAIGFLLGRTLAPAPEPLLATGGTLFAVVAPHARSVAVIGDFSAWQPVPLADPDRDGIWTATLELPPGRYEYAFLVDGRWIGQDPLADEHVRSFGEYASVRYVGGGA